MQSACTCYGTFIISTRKSLFLMPTLLDHMVITAMKRGSSSSSNEDSQLSSKRRKVKYGTFKSWVTSLDQEMQSMSWLDCDTEMAAGIKHVIKLKCRICTRYKDRIIRLRNFSGKWIEGADSLSTTNICDHAKSEQHLHAMNLERKRLAQSIGESPASYVPIAWALTTISLEEMEKLRVKFDIAYFIAKENIAFTKYSKFVN